MVMKKRRLHKTQSWLELLMLLVGIVVINALSSLYYKRFDLTQEKRYTLSETSRKLASRVEEKLYFKLYLDGEMSAKFKQLRNEIRDMAYEFREASGGKMEIEVTDPLKDKDKKEVAGILESFAERGMEPVRDVDTEDGDETRIKYLIPGAECIYRGKTIAIRFFQFDVSVDLEKNIKGAIDNIEYEMANALRQCVTEKAKKIVVADGSGEMLDARVNSFAKELSRYYSVEPLNLNTADPESGRPFEAQIKAAPDSADLVLLRNLQRRLNSSDLLMVIKPEKDYSPSELFLIDQFIMKGGKVIWLLDPVHIEMDSFQRAPTVMAMNKGLENITTGLFGYGVGLNADLLQDLTCNRIPLPMGGRMELIPFPYFPLFTSKFTSHIITKNIGAVWSQFPGTLKVKDRKGLKTTPLLVSSGYTKVANAPATVELMTVAMMSTDRNYAKSMNAGPQVSGVLMEGKFKSPFQFQKKPDLGNYLAEGNSSMVVISDGDIVRNFVSSKGGNFPTGYDRYSQITFANQKFMQNCIDYLIDDNGLIEIRARETQLRLLDSVKVKEEKSYWQWFNILLPLGFIALLGFTNYFIRKSKYTR
ncbi:MAG: gliding motility-associated ABC transporter substrate-binding protein GldG [Bacteroidetes bacterium]|nr:gliding motility-associated ABC transporter substrate-binding protein GldG [Bacteroidota bacterium]